MNIPPIVSRNFETLKVLSILAVVAGHFFPQTRLWLLSSIGLLIFGFSSGFFTAHLYGNAAELRSFLLNKVRRLGPNLLVINAFLLVLFLLRDAPGIWTWHSLIGIFGLTGWLNWLYIPNASPFGNGLWFFTLLLIFYLLYPLLYRLLANSVRGYGLLLLLFLGSLWLSRLIPYGHMLWLTAFAFCFGVAYVTQRWQATLKDSGWLLAIAFLGVVFAGILLAASVLSSLIILAAWLLLLQLAMRWPFPVFLSAPLKFLAPCLLEIYFLHTYLFVRPTQMPLLDFCISLLVIAAVSLLLNRLAGRIRLGLRVQ